MRETFIPHHGVLHLSRLRGKYSFMGGSGLLLGANHGTTEVVPQRAPKTKRAKTFRLKL